MISNGRNNKERARILYPLSRSDCICPSHTPIKCASQIQKFLQFHTELQETMAAQVAEQGMQHMTAERDHRQHLP